MNVWFEELKANKGNQADGLEHSQSHNRHSSMMLMLMTMMMIMEVMMMMAYTQNIYRGYNYS